MLIRKEGEGRYAVYIVSKEQELLMDAVAAGVNAFYDIYFSLERRMAIACCKECCTHESDQSQSEDAHRHSEHA